MLQFPSHEGKGKVCSSETDEGTLTKALCQSQFREPSADVKVVAVSGS